AEDLIAMRNELSNRVRVGLLPKLNAAADPREISQPRNDEAYALFLRSAPATSDPGPNKEALAMLERSTQLDPTYAPAWQALGQRYYWDAQYGDGGVAALRRAEDANNRALSIDPDLVS